MRRAELAKEREQLAGLRMVVIVVGIALLLALVEFIDPLVGDFSLRSLLVADPVGRAIAGTIVFLMLVCGLSLIVLGRKQEAAWQEFADLSFEVPSAERE
jgi:hypothetical protein